jgi:hypothetical protein
MRALTEAERAVIDRILQSEPQTLGLMRPQLDSTLCEPCGVCGGLCGGIKLFVADASPAPEVPRLVERWWLTGEGWDVNFLLWTQDGYLSSLEVLTYGAEDFYRLPRWPRREELDRIVAG